MLRAMFLLVVLATGCKSGPPPPACPPYHHKGVDYCEVSYNSHHEVLRAGSDAAGKRAEIVCEEWEVSEGLIVSSNMVLECNPSVARVNLPLGLGPQLVYVKGPIRIEMLVREISGQKIYGLAFKVWGNKK